MITFAVIECDSLPGISNGIVVQSGTTVDSTVTYNCNRGFTLEGLATHTCQADGEWSGEAPTCERKLLNIKQFYLPKSYHARGTDLYAVAVQSLLQLLSATVFLVSLTA